MNRALLALFAVASLAGCSDSTAPVSTEPIALRAIKTAQVLQITNNSDHPFYYQYFVGDGSRILLAGCLDPQTCPSVPARSSVSVRYKDIPKADPGDAVVTFMYYRLVMSGRAEPAYVPDTVRYASARL